ncbi:MAG: hypothetical protein HYS18_17205 [Burkholderiales bacterium]|nr:hypothetical protein [Burkholderiales bacterium]
MVTLPAKRLMLGVGFALAVLQPACGDADASVPRTFVAEEPQPSDAPSRLVRRLNHSQLQDADYERTPIQ